MYFRNLTMFRFPPSTDLTGLDAGLQECRLKPVGALELSSRGFVSPIGRDADELAHRQGAVIWLAVGGEDRLLPGSVVNDLLARKLEEIEQKEGRKPGGRTRKRIKDELITELLPRTLVQPSRVDTLLFPTQGLIVVDTASRGTAENVCSEIRRALGSFPALPLNAEVAPRSVLTGWLAGEPLPEGMAVGDECELQDPADRGALVKVQRMDLDRDEITNHLETGMQVTRLALNLEDHVSFVFGEDLVVRKFKLLDGAVDRLESTDHDDVRAEMDARMALMSAEVRELFAVLATAFKISKAEG